MAILSKDTKIGNKVVDLTPIDSANNNYALTVSIDYESTNSVCNTN